MRVVVVGAGFAGLAAAIDLQERGHSVVLLERRGVLGGRATSYRDALSGEEVDNGTHLLVGAYRSTRDLAARASAADLLVSQPTLRLDFVDDKGFSCLHCPSLPAPLHLLGGLLAFRVSWKARFDAARFAVHVRFGRPPHGLTLDEWFDRTGQGGEIRRLLWNPLTRAIINEDPARGAAILFYNVFRETFLQGREESTLVFLKSGFAAFHERLAAHFAARGGVLRRRAAARLVVASQGRVRSLTLKQNAEGREAILSGAGGGIETLDADAIVLAVPPAVTRRLVPESIRTHPPFDVLDSFGAAPIVSVDIWLDRRVVHETMIGLGDETMEWVFDKGRIFGRDGAPQHLSLLISAAHEATARPNADLVAAAEHALRRYFPSMSGVRIERSLVLREPEATFASRPQLEALRPKATTPIAGLFLAGDWTATGLPATIEGAVRSGFEASRRVCDWASDVNTTKGRTTWSDERSA